MNWIKKKDNIITKYTLAGFIFGILLRIIILFTDLQINDLDISIENTKQLHIINPLQYLINAVPFLMAFIAFIISKNVQKYEQKTRQIINRQIKKVNLKNEELKIIEEKLTKNNKKLQSLIEVSEIQKKTIQEKEQRLTTIIENQGEGFAVTDTNENFTFTNRVACEIFGVEDKQLIGRNLKDFLDKKELNIILEQAKHRKRNQKNTYNITITRPDKIRRRLMVTATPDYDDKNNIIGAIGTFRDITKLIQEQEKIKRLNSQLNKYFTAIEQSPTAILMTDTKGNIEYINPQFEKLTGYSFKDVKGENPRLLKSEHTTKEEYAELWKTISSGNVWYGEFLNYRKDRQKFWEKAVISSVKNTEGKITNYLAIKIDITKLKKAEQVIQEKTRLQQIIIDNLPAHIYLKNEKLEYLLVNKSYSKALNTPINEIIGKRDIDIISHQAAEEYEKQDKQIIETCTELLNYERQHKTSNGKEYWTSTSKVPYSNNDNINGIIGIVQDITEKVKLIAKQNKLSDSLHKSLNLVLTQKSTIEKTHRHITDSINYAKTIQEALLTPESLMKEYLKDYFLLFKPKDIVSGDFYYVNKINNQLVFAVADCTGHGVPGGFITVLGITYLHAINLQKIDMPSGNILNILREQIKATFRTFGSENSNGLDIAHCKIDTKTNILQYAGAYNSLFIIRNNKLIEYKATRSPIGFYPVEKVFENTEIQLLDNDLIYLFSDGYLDQYNYEDTKKFSKKRFKQTLLDICAKPLSEQKIILENILQNWKKNTDQLDDITILGIKWKKKPL